MQPNPTISVTANGEGFEADPGAPLEDFLQRLGLEPDQVVVEFNGAALPPSRRREVRLADGDRMEIVRIVAGG